MRAATLRRSLVFAVCALGVGALYLAPTIVRSPDQLAVRQPSDEPTGLISPAGASSTVQTGSETGSSAGQPDEDPPRTQRRSSERNDGDSTTTTRAERSTPRGATAYDPKTKGDDEPPAPVTKITPAKVTADRLSLDWTKAEDNVRVVGYHVWLNGFDVASTAETHATIRWFNDDTSTHVVQVKAVDEAGNQSASSPSLLVTRPDPEPGPSDPPTPLPTDEPKPSTDPEPSATPTAGPSESAQIAPSSRPSGSSGPG